MRPLHSQLAAYLLAYHVGGWYAVAAFINLEIAMRLSGVVSRERERAERLKRFAALVGVRKKEQTSIPGDPASSPEAET